MSSNPECVQVAVRIRPLVEIERNAGYQLSIQGVPETNQVQFINSDKGFTYNHVFDETTNQQEFYEKCVQPMLDKLFKGYNVTILAYGQTGSGKTHSMGTAYDGTGEMGVIPRAIYDIFNYADNTDGYEFKITVSFMELYQESLYDLLADRPRDQCVVDIRDDGNKGIRIPGLTEIPVTTIEDTIKCLISGSSGRATGATAMNAQSSRSHAIFTITIYTQKKDDNNTATTSKFHLVDLAGSERSKKTKAIGERFKEGVNINIGLLALGNVISSLGEGQKYISYRDSKLTRLLQDSLGGNSLTLMIACVSPADYNIEETLSTLRYADRARKIKNKPIVNQDPRAAEIARLQQIIQQLRCEKLAEGNVTVNCEEFEKLKEEINRLQKRNRELNTALSSALAENTCMFERALLTQTANERLQKKLLELKETYNVTLSNLNNTLQLNDQQQCDANTNNTKNTLMDQVEKLEFIKNMVEDLETEHKKNEEELQKHELQSATPRLNRNHVVDHELHSSEPDLDAKQEKHTTEQLSLNNELKELNRVLAIKEQLASQMMANVHHLHVVDYTSIEENQEKISTLEKEKDDLLQQLKSVQSNSNNACSKISEQRRKRVKELETQISELNKKVHEQARMIKLKEKDEAKIRLLNNEIQSMKAAKVKLIKTMRSEEQKFREWKMQREKELMRLKDQDRKRQNQIIRMENMHCKQQNVLKRKVEEAAAINKRLKDALALQKQAQERRALNTGKSERVEQWIDQEFEVMIRTLEAERTREQLFEDRASLMDELNKIQADEEYVNTEKGRNHVKQLNEHIELRHAQINELHQKIMDSDQESKSKTRFDIIQSMVDAKCALRKLFDLAANIRKKSFVNDYKLEEVNSAFEEAQTKLTSCEKQLRAQESEHKHKLSELEREYEEKVSVVLRQLRQNTPDTNDEILKERLRIQEEALEKMDELRNEVKYYKEELQSLRDKMNQVNQCEKKKKTAPKPKIMTTPVYKEEIIDEDTSIDLVPTDDEDNDPDWKKTPLYRRMMSALQQDRPIKRSSDGTIKCSCKGKCSSKLCGCRKKNNICSDQCNCISENCVNRDASQSQNNVARKIFENDESSEDSFKKHGKLWKTDSAINVCGLLARKSIRL